MDFIMQLFTQVGSLPVAIAVPVVMLLSEHQAVVNLGRMVALILVISQLVVHTLKFAVYRDRPFRVLDDIIANRPPTSKRSFPSGHTCAAFALALPMSAVIPGIAAFAITVASLVGVSRVYLGAHYPSDVLAGIGIALLSFWATMHFLI